MERRIIADAGRAQERLHAAEAVEHPRLVRAAPVLGMRREPTRQRQQLLERDFIGLRRKIGHASMLSARATRRPGSLGTTAFAGALRHFKLGSAASGEERCGHAARAGRDAGKTLHERAPPSPVRSGAGETFMSPSVNTVALLVAASVGAWTASAGAQSPTAQQLEATPFVSGLTYPTWVGSPPGDHHRLFVLEVDGRVRLVKDGVLQAASFLDITDKAEQGAQSGLLGMAFHPDFARNGWFYLYYSISFGSSMIERYTVSSADPDLADPASALAMLPAPITDPAGFHMGGGMDFGPDGRIYVGIGDSRSLDGNTCYAQHLDTLLGKVLRLNEDGGIPQDNPFVGVAGARPEIWDLGVREPYRLRFDPLSGDLFIADVGESQREELNVHPAGAPGGRNFGWRVMEGELCTGDAQCATFTCPDPTYAAPLYSFAHASGLCCILGGGIYQGAGIPAADGSYLFGEYCSRQIFALHLNGVGAPTAQALPYDVPAGPITQLVSVGFDTDGEPLLVDFANYPTGAGQGKLWRLLPKSFQDIGGALGSPSFAGEGSLAAGATLALTLQSAKPGAHAWLVAGLQTLAQPFKGGVMMPSPDAIVSGLIVNAHGKLPLAPVWPAGIPAGLPLVMQWWIADPSGPQGFTASNALKATTH
jgi:glucose/arabinose dehydrogenase